jgi:hypothetical protein
MKRALSLLVAVVLLAGEPAIAAPVPLLADLDSPLRTLCDLLYRMGQDLASISSLPGR